MAFRITVNGFLPSRNGFHFSNAFPPVPYEFMWLGLPFKGGSANNGVCGGMIYSAIDFYQAGSLPPADTTAPGSGPLFRYLCQRLIDSFDIPAALMKYYAYMNPLYQSGDRQINLGLFKINLHGHSWVMVGKEWPKIQLDINRNQLCPIGIILRRSWNPDEMGRNHQVLVYGYEKDGDVLRLLLYDPNYPDDDTVTIGFNLFDPAAPQRAVYARSSGRISDVYCFFRTHYRRNRTVNVSELRV